MPGRKSMMRYWPVPSVTTDRDFSISAALDASTVTPGSTAPDASLTTPVMTACDQAADGNSTQRGERSQQEQPVHPHPPHEPEGSCLVPSRK